MADLPFPMSGESAVDLLPGDIVQITAPAHHWFGALIVVSELKSFGIQGYAPIPRNDGSGTGSAYIRLQVGEYERVGKAEMIPEAVEDERLREVAKMEQIDV